MIIMRRVIVMAVASSSSKMIHSSNAKNAINVISSDRRNRKDITLIASRFDVSAIYIYITETYYSLIHTVN